ncbi:hypothetical protein ACWDRB_65915 [Nonomuraea sp. NPDC003707]
MVPERIFGAATRHDGDPDRVAVLLPGRGYVPARPLLHFAGAVLRRHGWSVREVWWQSPATQDAGELAGWVMEQARQALDGERAERLLLVGKSLGTFAAPLAAERGLPAIWLTPLLRHEAVVEALRRTGAPTVLVGGSADKLWDGEAARGLGHPYLEVPGADHGLEAFEDPVRSVEILRDVTAEMDRFVAGLRS